MLDVVMLDAETRGSQFIVSDPLEANAVQHALQLHA